jgi:aldose 1-epimerase
MMNFPLNHQALTSLVLCSHAGLRVEILPLGATIISIQLNGRELTLRHQSLNDYLLNDGYLGATVGRYANRIAHGKLDFNGQTWLLDTAGGEHCLHGGSGFSHKCWQVVRHEDSEIELFLHSPAGDSGFPGDLSVWQQITLVGTEVRISFRAITTSATVVSLTNHCYFNLDGSSDTADHQLQLFSDQFLPVGANLIPTGRLQFVTDSAFDFSEPVTISANLAKADPQLRLVGGFDHCFVFPQNAGVLRQMATLSSDLSGIRLMVSSTMPGLQFYGGHALNAPFSPRQGLCLEAQNWPDAPNRPGFPNATLRSGEVYQQQIVYTFSQYDSLV